MDADVIVVGAGPAGSATALLLARRGHHVLIVDRARFPRPKPCGEYLNPGAVDVLRRLGVADAAGRAGVSISGMFIAGPGGETVWAPFPTGHGLLVPRERLDHLLMQAAVRAGADVIEECRVDAVTPGSPVVVAARRALESVRLRARLVVGADGIRSVVARREGPLAPARGHYTMGARFEDLAVDTPRGDLHLGWGWYAGAAVYGHGGGNVVVAVPRAALQRSGGDGAAVFHQACASLPELSAMLVGARRVTPFVSVGPLGYTRRPSVDDGVVLVGDAAGTINPMTGEGIALALRGAELAATTVDRALRTGDASRRALAGYEHARRAAFGGVWTVSRALQWIVRRPQVAARLFRGLARDPALASHLLGVVGDVRPVRDILNAGYIFRLMAHASGSPRPHRRAV